MRPGAISTVLSLASLVACQRQDFTGPLVFFDAAPDAIVDAGFAAADTAPPPKDAAPDAPPPPLPTSCNDARAHDGSIPTGLVTIDTDGPGARASLRVWCDMDIDDGGWTLIALSAPGATDAFDWVDTFGAPAGGLGPYSLAPAAAGLVFTSVLVGARDPGPLSHAWRYAYKLPIDPAFLAAHTVTSTSIEPVAILTCGPGVPSFLRHAGYTDRTGSFFFRDSDDGTGISGLTPNGWTFAGIAPPDGIGCATYGGLYGAQGMIMVR